jgi:hypothetical protein
MPDPRQHRSFDPGLDRILDRVYGLEFATGSGRSDRLIVADAAMARARQDVAALESALDGLRQLRERSQGLTSMREEITYLQEQIVILKQLCEEIGRLRAELAMPPPTAQDQGPDPAHPAN